MHDTITQLVVFTSAALFAFSVGLLLQHLWLRRRYEIQKRVAGLSDHTDQDGAAQLFRNPARLGRGAAERARSWREWGQLQLHQAGIEWNPWVCVVVWAAATTVVCVLTCLWSLPIALVLGSACCALPVFVLRAQQVRLRRKFERQLPHAFSTISRAVRAGQTVQSAMRIVAYDGSPPLSRVFARCLEQQNLGMTRESSLRQLGANAKILELQMFVVGILVQARSGGNLAELLDGLAGIIRKRLALKERVRSLTGEGRMQAAVLQVLPFLAFAGIVTVAPDYADALMERPWLLAATLSAQLVGGVWIHTIVNGEY